jgi:tetratricopeptide (TPR) repeat protein
MTATSGRWVGAGAVAAGLFLLAGGAGRADDEPKDSPLRAELKGLKLNEAATEDAQNGKLRALMKDKEKAKKLVAEAAKMMAEAKDEKPFNYNGALILGAAARRVKAYDAAEAFLKHEVDLATKLKSGPKMRQAHLGLIGLYFETKRYDVAAEAAENAVDLRGPMEYENAKPFLLERLVQAKAKQGKIDDALNMTKGLLELTDGAWYFLQLKGWVQREGGKLDDAIATYTEVLDKIEADKNLKGSDKDEVKDDVRYVLSGLHVDNKEVDKAAKQLQTLIKRNPDNAGYKNDLGFIWCDHDMNLEESEKLIREALDLDKKAKEKAKEEGKLDEVRESAAYLDSLGWVLFKQKKYKEALDPLKKAAADDEQGSHLEIWDHLADCHYALGEKKEAVAAWQKALKMEDLTKRDGERRRKVSEKLRKAKDELEKE